MGKYKELVHQLPEEKEVMEHLTDITDVFVESIKVTHPQKYSNFIQEIKKISSHNHFDEESIMDAKPHMSEKFKIEETNKMAVEMFDIDFEKESFSKQDFYYILNEMYCQFSNVFGEDKSKYGELALAWLDKNDGKAKVYFEKMYKH